MAVLLALLYLAIGGAILFLSGEGLVKGAASLATRHGISRLVVGLTVVAFGTSAPELFVSVLSSFRGLPDIALGNVLGSNIVNIGVALGGSAILSSLTVHVLTVRYEIPFLMLVSGLAWLLAADGTLGRWDAAGLLVLFGAFLWYCLRTARAAPESEAQSFAEPFPTKAHDAAYIVLGLAGLVLGSEVFVRGASSLARVFGVPELVIGLTVVAVGTSIPEIVTSLAAARLGESDFAVGNIVGSNLFNLLLILGCSAMVSPLPCGQDALLRDFPVMMGFNLVLLPLLLPRRILTRWKGAAFVLLYATYIGWLIGRV